MAWRVGDDDDDVIRVECGERRGCVFGGRSVLIKKRKSSNYSITRGHCETRQHKAWLGLARRKKKKVGFGSGVEREPWGTGMIVVRSQVGVAAGCVR